MSRKHFIKLAQMVANLRGQMTEEVRRQVAERLCEFCAEQNSMFQREPFMSACGF